MTPNRFANLPDPWSVAGAWTGGTVSSLALLASGPEKAPIVLAATGAGIFRSEDQGRSWMRSSAGLDDPAVAAVAAASGAASQGDVAQADVAFAGTENGRLYRSDDGGETWFEIESWAGLGTANAIVPSPNFAEEPWIFVATSGGVMRSSDGGRSWESSTFGLLDVEVLCLACAPEFGRNRLMWTGTAAGGLYRSRNAALAWRESGSGLPDAAVQCIAVSPRFAADSTLWVGLEGHGVYRSVDGGEQWTQAGRGLDEASVNALVVVPAPDSSATDGSALVAATDRGLYFSMDGGVQWSPATSGGFAVLDLLALPDGQVLGATYIDGVIRSGGSLGEWEAANGGLSAHAPPLVAVAADSMLALDRDGAAALSSDGGGSWVGAHGDGEFGQFSALATGRSGENFYLASDEHVVCLSARGGAIRTYPAPFDVESPPHVMAAAPVPEQKQPTLALAAANGPIYLTSDLDGPWTEIPSPAPDETIFHVDLWAAANARAAELTAISGWPDPRGYYQFNVWSWEPGTAAWKPLASLASDIAAVLLCVAESRFGVLRFLATQNRLVTLYPGTEVGEIEVAQHFFDADVRITALVCSPHFASDPTVCAASNKGLYRSTDAGGTWTLIPTPEPMPAIVSMQWDSGQTVSVTVIGGEVLRVRLPA